MNPDAVNRHHPAHIKPNDLGIQDHNVDYLNLTDRIELKDRVGGGGYSDIWIGILRGDDGSSIEVAAKQLLVKSRELSMPYKVHLQRRFCREVLLWNKLRHSNIVPLQGYIVSIDGLNAFPALISPWYTQGNIVDHLKINPQANRKQLLLDVASGLQYLHELPLVHGDIKGGNILVDASGRASLCDFGMSGFINDVEDATDFKTVAKICGTQRFMCPELLISDQKDQPIDIWAFGCVAIQVMLDRLPYQHKRSQSAIYKSTISGEPPILERDLALDPADETLWRDIQKCWSFEPAKRPTVTYLLSVLSNSVNASPPANIDITDKVELGDLIEQGDRWTIFRGSLQTDGEPSQVVVKVIRVLDFQKLSVREEEEDHQQIRHLISLRHPNIVPIFGYINNPVTVGWHLSLVLPFYNNGDLENYLSLNTASATKFRVLLDVARGIRYLHHVGVVHGDIRVGNIIVNANGDALLHNYETSCLWEMNVATSDININMSSIMVRYLAPEVVAGKPKTNATDIWAFGCLSTQIVTGDIPYRTITACSDIVDAIKQGQLPTPFEEKLSDLPHVHLWGSIRRCWDQDPSERPEIAQLFSALADLEPLPDLKDLDLSQKLELKEKVADGGYSVVFFGVLSDHSHHKVAVKALRVSNNSWKSGMAVEERLQKRFYREILLWSRLTHPNIVPLLGFALISDVLPSLVSPWYENGTVMQYLRVNPKADRIVLLFDVIRGLHYLHQEGFVHGDIKADNVLVDSDGKASLGDFGLSKFIDSEYQIKGLSTVTGFHGNLRFASPESLEEDARTFMTDVWAFACLAIQILKNCFPYQHVENDAAVPIKIMTGELPLSEEELIIAPANRDISTELRSCWNFDPTVRPTITRLLSIWPEQIYSRDYDRSVADLLAQPSSPPDLTESLSTTRLAGFGGYSDVWRGSLRQQNGTIEVAVKVLRIEVHPLNIHGKIRIEQKLLEQTRIWGQVDHPNVVPFLGLTRTSSVINLVSPWCANENVAEYLSREPRTNRLPLAFDVVQGLRYLHKIGIIHGDIQGKNVLVNSLGQACLCDFGHAILRADSKESAGNTPADPFTGTVRFSAPERLNGQVPTTLSDIWAFGCVFIQIMLLQLPYEQVPGHQLRNAIINEQSPLPVDWEPPVSASERSLWGTVRHCWNQDPFHRPSLETLWATIKEVCHKNVFH